jgi:hypothetical protein
MMPCDGIVAIFETIILVFVVLAPIDKLVTDIG